LNSRRVFGVIYFCSGAAGLIYEVVWTRLLSLQLGHTVWAVGTVLAAFMGGLALGALIAGSVASRIERGRALQLYAVVEVAIALWAIALPFAFRAIEPLFVSAYGDQPGSTFALVRLASSLTLVTVPAAAMGAAFPLAITWFSEDRSVAGRDTGWLYALNTIGAAAGALLTGFVLVPQLGLRTTTFVGVALNAVAASGAWLLARSAQTPALAPAGPPRARAKKKPSPSPARRGASDAHAPVPRWLTLAVLGVSGFAALVYEIAFTRALAIAIGPTTYAFAAMLAAFIGGMAIGAAATSRVAWTNKAAVAAMGVLMVVSAAAAALASWFTGTRLPLLVAEAVAEPSIGPAGILARQAFYSVGVLLPVGCSLGAIVPLGLALVARGTQAVARDASIVYGIDTIGAVLGSLAGAFLMVPAFGLQQTLRIASLLAIAVSCVVFLVGPLSWGRRAAGLMAAFAVMVLLVALPRWDTNLLSSGAYKYATEVVSLNLDLATGLKAGRLVYYKEGATATVSVRQLAGTIALAIDGKVDASNRTDMLTQKLLAHLPLLLHADPHDICIIGLGSGVTLGAALRHGIERADIIEISPEVVEASSFFANDNGHALDDPRTKLLVSDGRTHLQLTSRQYDVIISEPSNPWIAGIASLFTREFFVAARARLRPGGIICQWAHTYDISDADLRSIAATFTSVFPNGTMWLVGDGDLLFIATNDAAGPRIDNIARGWERPGVSADLAKASVFDTFSLLSLYAGGPLELRRYGQAALVQTDDRMGLEFSGPLGVYDRRLNRNAPALAALLDRDQAPAAVRTARATAGSREWEHFGKMLLSTHAYSRGFDAFTRAVRLDPENEAAFAGFIEAAGSAERVQEAQQVLESVANAQRSTGVAVRVAQARLLAATGAFGEAAARAREVMTEQPQNPAASELLASILADAGDLNGLRGLAARMREAHPERDDSWYYAAMVSFLSGDLPEAIRLAERAVQVNPHHTLANNLIGAAYARLGQRDRARDAFRASLEANPTESSTYRSLGLLELESGNLDAATAYFAEALTLDPHDQVARENLSATLVASHQS
jgi:spermidine synthase